MEINNKNKEIKKLELIITKVKKRYLTNTFNFRLLIGIIFGNILSFVIFIIIPFDVEIAPEFIYLPFIIALITAIVAGTIAKGNKKSGILSGLLSQIILILIFLHLSVMYTLIIFLGIIGLVGGVIGNYFVTKNKYFPIVPALSIIAFLVYIFFFATAIQLGGGILGTTCIASSGYLCQNPIYQHSSGYIIVTLGQSTGTSWTSANFMFVPQGQAVASGLPVTLTSTAFATGLGNTITGGLKSGQTTVVYLPVNGITSVPVGTPVTGSIWARYDTSNQSVHYVEIATINIKAS
jgi:hypothetical protein